MPNLLQPPFEPYMKLAQSNASLITDFWTSPNLLWQPGPVPSAPTSAATATSPATAGQQEAFSRLFKGLLENYIRFLFELGQNGWQAWSQAQRSGDAARSAVDAEASRTAA